MAAVGPRGGARPFYHLDGHRQLRWQPDLEFKPVAEQLAVDLYGYFKGEPCETI